MSYRIEKGETLAAAFGRISAEEIDQAMAEVGRPDDRGEAVHNARKAMKRLRALLQSLKVAFPRKTFRAEHRRIAAIGRKFSPLRDIHVQLRTLEKLQPEDNQAGDQIRRRWLRRQTSILRKVPNLRKTVRGMLDISRQSLSSRPLRDATAHDLATGLKRLYRQGRKAFRIARASPDPSHLHAWRKKAKSLGYGLLLIENLAPAKMAKMNRRSDALSEALGDDHDLFMVLDALRVEHRAVPAGDFAALAKRIRRERKKLQQRAFKLGKQLYDEKPARFERRLDHCLRHAKVANKPT